jgi:hypothetical protein
VTAVACLALALLAGDGGAPKASEPPKASEAPKPSEPPKACPATSFSGGAAFLVVGKISGKGREAIGAAQRARARGLEATVVRGALFEAAGKGTLVVYGAFAREGEATARVAALAKKKIAAAVLRSGKPASTTPLVRICGEARREGLAIELAASDARFSHVPVAIKVGGQRVDTETDTGGYFEIWLAGAGKAGLFIPAFAPEARDANNLCGYMGSSNDVQEEVDLPADTGGSVRAPALRQTITHCGE